MVSEGAGPRLEGLSLTSHVDEGSLDVLGNGTEPSPAAGAQAVLGLSSVGQGQLAERGGVCLAHGAVGTPPRCHS